MITPTAIASRADRFVAAAIEILGETGRTDFTVQEVVERARTSLRSFYQSFASKEELLLALCEEIVEFAVVSWRVEIADLPCFHGMRVLVDNLYGRTVLQDASPIARAVSSYHLHLAGTRPRQHARVLAPIRDLLAEVIERGVVEGVVRTDVGTEALASMVMQTLVGSAHMAVLGEELPTPLLECDQLWRFCVGALARR